MLENPGEELYFGEVYRQILQEAWLPKGSELWERVGKSRRGSRPTQKGLYAHSPTDSQAAVRQCFSKCAAGWRALPWDNPSDRSCDNRWGKQYWYDLKHSGGYPCSYYDLYMRFCMRHCIDTGCLPPANYLLGVQGDLSQVRCNAVYDVNFPNKCGEVSMVSGEGEFVAPSEWVSPKFGTEGALCFKDKNGSYGSIPYSFSTIIAALEWDPANPVEVDPDDFVSVYILGGAPPFQWSVSGSGFFFDSEHTITEVLTTDRRLPLCASALACGAATIKVTDNCGADCTGTVRCTAGGWGTYYCRERVRYCVGGECGSQSEFIVGDRKYVYMCCSSGCGEECPDVQTLSCEDGSGYTFTETTQQISIMAAYKWLCP